MDGTAEATSVYRRATLYYLASQEAMNILALAWSRRIGFQTFDVRTGYFVAPALTWVLAGLVARRWRANRGSPASCRVLAWFALVVPQVAPAFIHGLNIIYVSWTLIMGTTAAGTGIFSDISSTGRCDRSSETSPRSFPWFNRERPHQSLGQRTPDEVHARRARRPERTATSGVLAVRFIAGGRRLPVLRLRDAA